MLELEGVGGRGDRREGGWGRGGGGGREGNFTGSLTIDSYVQNVKASLRALHFFVAVGGL